MAELKHDYEGYIQNEIDTGAISDGDGDSLFFLVYLMRELSKERALKELDGTGMDTFKRELFAEMVLKFEGLRK